MDIGPLYNRSSKLNTYLESIELKNSIIMEQRKLNKPIRFGTKWWNTKLRVLFCIFSSLPPSRSITHSLSHSLSIARSLYISASWFRTTSEHKKNINKKNMKYHFLKVSRRKTFSRTFRQRISTEWSAIVLKVKKKDFSSKWFMEIILYLGWWKIIINF